MIKLYAPAEIKSTSKEGENDIYEVLVSSGKVDRFGDTINPKGWYLTNYNKNPVILWAHQSGGMFGTAIPPVGQATKTWVKDEKELWQKQIFAPTPLAQELKTLVDGKFLRAQSVGFLPLVEDEKGNIDIEGKMYRRIFEEELNSYIEKGFVEIAGKKYSKEGTHFDKQELLEVSWVDVPALPTALVAARKMNLALMTKALEEQIKEIELEIKPYANEHSCRLESPDKYKRFRRQNCQRKHDGKCIDVIWGITKGEEEKTEQQAFRYDKEVWTAASAKTHCGDNDGAFEPASEESIEDYDTCKCGSKEIETLNWYPSIELYTTASISEQKCKECGRFRRIESDVGKPMKLLSERFETKAGRVLSEKNRTLINNCLKQMGVAIDALKVLLKATEQPEKDITPKFKGRSHGITKGGRNPELRYMQLANKAVENALRDLKENKSGRKVEIRYLQIASKVVDAAIIKAKAKK